MTRGAGVSSHPKTPTISRTISSVFPKLVRTSDGADASTGVPTKWARGCPYAYHQTQIAAPATERAAQIQTRRDQRGTAESGPGGEDEEHEADGGDPQRREGTGQDEHDQRDAEPVDQLRIHGVAGLLCEHRAVDPDPIAPPISMPLGLTVDARNSTIGEIAIAKPPLAQIGMATRFSVSRQDARRAAITSMPIARIRSTCPEPGRTMRLRKPTVA